MSLASDNEYLTNENAKLATALAAEREKREVWETECAAANAAIARVEALCDKAEKSEAEYAAGYVSAQSIRAALSTQEDSNG